MPGRLENRSRGALGTGVAVHFTTLGSQFTLITEQLDGYEPGTVAHSCQFCGVSYRFSSVRDPQHVRPTQVEHRTDHSRRQSTPATRIKTQSGNSSVRGSARFSCTQSVMGRQVFCCVPHVGIALLSCRTLHRKAHARCVYNDTNAFKLIRPTTLTTSLKQKNSPLNVLPIMNYYLSSNNRHTIVE